MLARLYRWGVILNYKWAMANAYLTQHYAPSTSVQWLQDADHWRMELWRMDRGMI